MRKRAPSDRDLSWDGPLSHLTPPSSISCYFICCVSQLRKALFSYSRFPFAVCSPFVNHLKLCTYSLHLAFFHFWHDSSQGNQSALCHFSQENKYRSKSVLLIFKESSLQRPVLSKSSQSGKASADFSVPSQHWQRVLWEPRKPLPTQRRTVSGWETNHAWRHSTTVKYIRLSNPRFESWPWDSSCITSELLFPPLLNGAQITFNAEVIVKYHPWENVWLHIHFW